PCCDVYEVDFDTFGVADDAAAVGRPCRVLELDAQAGDGMSADVDVGQARSVHVVAFLDGVEGERDPSAVPGPVDPVVHPKWRSRSDDHAAVASVGVDGIDLGPLAPIERVREPSAVWRPGDVHGTTGMGDEPHSSAGG